ncbi:hypothetical protein [Solibacillus sp. FSL H8-0538]|uniref:hypothetical protein n=1 Tax=Solibacillus sp. FSL H8-0538 TaxID=2921400 RepID=UPI0030F97CAB
MNKEMLLSLMDKVVKVDRGGPESRIGKLLAAGDDYFTVITEEDGVVYYKTQHIKSLTIDTKSGLKFNMEMPEKLEYLQDADFVSVIGNLYHHWIKVNRGGPEMIEGILDEITKDYVTIISNGEVIRLSMYHIRNISAGSKAKESNEEKGNSKQTKNSYRRK